MIYRVHKPYKQDGSFGSLSGYVSLCHGFISLVNIYDALLQSKIISSDWFTVKDLQASKMQSPIHGVHSWSIIRRTSKAHLFFLYPAEANRLNPAQTWTSNKFTVATGSITDINWQGLVNQVISYMPNPAVPVPAVQPDPRANARTILQEEIDRQILADMFEPDPNGEF